VSALALPDPALARAATGRGLGGAGRLATWVALVGLLAVVAMASLALGAKPIPFGTVWDSLWAYDAASNDQLIIRSLRVPRTVLGIIVGASLGLAGAVMQGVARNPLADPGILGVNAGAALAVVVGIHVFGVASLLGYVWFAFAGAAVASVVVYALASVGRDGATPVKLALAGAAMTSLLASLTSTVLLIDVSTLDQYRFWAVGSLAGRSTDIAAQVGPFAAAGTVLALAGARSLNTLALGDDVARSLGQRVGLARTLAATAVVVLVGSATAAAGPIAFVGLAIPHVARAIVGPDYRWILPYSMVLAPVLLLGADVLGRVVARPGELQVGIVTALAGAPVFILLVRRRRTFRL
jgi:iron complex transport system permease protein